MIIFLAICTFLATLIGGVVTIKFKKYLPYFFAFAAGSLIAVSFLDLLPESIKIAGDVGMPVRYLMLAVVGSFFVYSLLEKFFLTHHMHDPCCDNHSHPMGKVGALSLVAHSLMDGICIGAAFKVSPSVGFIISIAIIIHDCSDGVSVVSVMLKNKQKIRDTILFLCMDALAPIIGVVVASITNIQQNVLAIILSIFIGEFLYISAASLLPEIREHKSKKLYLFMGLGIGLIAVLTEFI